MIKTKVFLWKTKEGNGTLRVRVRVRVKFILFYSELAPTDPWYNMLRTLLGRKKYEEAMSDKHPLRQSCCLFKRGQLLHIKAVLHGTICLIRFVWYDVWTCKLRNLNNFLIKICMIRFLKHRMTSFSSDLYEKN